MDEKGIYTKINELIVEYIRSRCPNWSDGDIQWIVAGMWDAYNLGVGKIADFHKQVEDMQKTELVNKALFDYSKGLSDQIKNATDEAGCISIEDAQRILDPLNHLDVKFAERQQQANEAQANVVGLECCDKHGIWECSDCNEPKPKKRGMEWL